MNLSEINKEIDRLEHCDTTYNNCEKLSILYTCRNNYNKNEAKTYSYSYRSEFIDIAKDADFNELLKILDEHMEALKAIYPKEYMAIMKKISDTI